MRYLYLLLLLAVAPAAHGQAPADTLGREALPVQQAAEALPRVASRTDPAGLCYETLRWAGARGLVRIYYASGHLKEYVPYADLGAGRVHGLATTWHVNGQPESRQPFLEGQRTGQLELYYANGQLKRRTEYAAGAELPGQCFDAAGRPVAYFSYEQLPLYPGGQAQLTKELTSALRMPRDVPPLLGPRTVGISFLVDEDGNIREPRVAVSSRLPALDRAVLATIQRLTRRFTPARRDGLVVQSSYYIPVQFSSVPYLERLRTN